MKNRKLPILIALLAIFSSATLSAQENQSIIKNYLNSNQTGKKAIENFLITNEDPSTSLKGSVVQIQQTVDNIPVFNSYGTALIQDGAVKNFTNNFQQSLPALGNKNSQLTNEDFISKILSNLKISNSSAYKFKVSNDDSGIAAPKTVYYNDGKNYILAQSIEFDEKGTSNTWLVVANANTGEILYKQNLTLSCNFDQNNKALPSIISQNKGIKNAITLKNDFQTNHQISTDKNVDVPVLNSSKLAVTNATYNVFQLPLEAPSFGSRTLLQNPWDLSASPLGWQNDNTTTYTYTRGNNVYAYTDLNSTNAIGQTADGGAALAFDFPLNLPDYDTNYTNAALTNLFYLNNREHDILYKFGFNETAKNFQKYNNGLGGTGNDNVLAEARDGANNAFYKPSNDTAGNPVPTQTQNNANFSTPSDGSSGRMQMYIWNSPYPYGGTTIVDPNLYINSPAAIAGPVAQNGEAQQFGPPAWKQVTTGDLTLAPSDAINGDACTALTAGSMTGKIGLAKRGVCSFVIKIKNMQNAGAIAGILYDNVVATTVSNMIGIDTTITIPSYFLTNVLGSSIAAQITAGQTVNMTLGEKIKDGSLDNAIMAHEYGHGLSNRLHPTVSCLNATSDAEQMGEGWSDFMSLMLTNQPGDTAATPRSVGTYVVSQSPTDSGIRPAPYSPDMDVNGYTYADVTGMTEVHDIGFVWATILWDLHWKYVEKYGYASIVTDNMTSGSAKAFQVVINGMKLDPCNPTFVSGRDAIVAADQAATGGADRCMILNVFAKRGVGALASAGSLTTTSDNVSDFSVPTECILATTETNSTKQMSLYPNPAKNEFFLKSSNSVLGKVNVDIYDAAGRLVSSEKVSPSSNEAISTQQLPNGIYLVKVNGIGVQYSSKLIIKK